SQGGVDTVSGGRVRPRFWFSGHAGRTRPATRRTLLRGRPPCSRRNACPPKSVPEDAFAQRRQTFTQGKHNDRAGVADQHGPAEDAGVPRGGGQRPEAASVRGRVLPADFLLGKE